MTNMMATTSTWTEGDEASVSTDASIGSFRSKHSSVYRNYPFLFGSFVMIFVMCFVGTMEQYEATKRHHSHTRQNFVAFASGGNKGGKRAPPTVIYQFDSTVVPGERKTRKLPYVWHQVWENAGWSPQKLFVSRRASEYTEVLNQVEQSDTLTPLQKRHIYKYLAMASAGGGWLAHADVLPLQPFYGNVLPHGGKFTLYDGVHNEPCFLSASSTEWLRIGKLLAQHATGHQGEDWNEKLALQELRNEFVVQSEVYTVESTVNATWVWNSQDCKLTHQQRVVHFDLEELGVEDPGDRVVKWMSMWLQACERTDVFLKQDHEHGHEVGRSLSQQHDVASVGAGPVQELVQQQENAVVPVAATNTAKNPNQERNLNQAAAPNAQQSPQNDMDKPSSVRVTSEEVKLGQELERNLKSQEEKKKKEVIKTSLRQSTEEVTIPRMGVQQEFGHQVGRKLVPERHSMGADNVNVMAKTEPVNHMQNELEHQGATPLRSLLEDKEEWTSRANNGEKLEGLLPPMSERVRRRVKRDSPCDQAKRERTMQNCHSNNNENQSQPCSIAV